MLVKSKAVLLVCVIVLQYIVINPAHATDVSSWLDIEDNKDGSDISFANNIKASGKEYYENLVITLTSDGDQTIDGNHYSFTGDDRLVNDRWYYYNISVQKNGGSLTLQNMGKVSDGTADTNTFQYVDLDGNTVYKTIDTKVSGWNTYFLSVHNPIDVDIKNSVFADNGKEKDARLIRMQPSNGGTLNVTNSIFYNNTTASTSPVLYTNQSDLNVDNTIFYDNLHTGVTTPWGGSTPQGGALQSDGGKVAITNSYFINNTAARETVEGKGGAVYIGAGAGHTIENSKFEGNKAARTGGGFYQYYNATVDYIKNSEFIGNEATGSSGGGVALGGGYLRTIDNVLFDNNVSGNQGGGLYVEELVEAPEPKVMLIKDTTFTNNNAVLGGGMYFSADFGINENFAARVVDPEFTSNTATKGGALYIINGDLSLISENKDIIFTGNTATDISVANAGDDVYVKTNTYAGTLYLNAADDKKIAFNGSVGAEKRKSTSPTPNIAINKSDMTYSTYEGETETIHNAGTTGEIQFNSKVGDEFGNIFNINLYGGTLSIGQNSAVNAGVENADGYINNNNFTVAGDSTLNTANGLIGLFAPKTFTINSGIALQYSFDIDLINGISDQLGDVVNNGSLLLSNLNIISDSESDVKITYSNANINGALKDGYTIGTSTATYEVSAGNDDTGSFLLISQPSSAGGIANAIKDGVDSYSITTNEENESVEEWYNNDLISDLVINGNGHGFVTENNLEGIIVGENYHLAMNNISDMLGFQYSISNAGNVELNNTTLHGDLINSGTADLNNSQLNDALQNSGTAIVTSSILGGLVNTADGVATLTDSTVNDDVVNSGEASISGTTIKGAVTNSGTTELSENTVVDGTVLNDKEITVANSTIKGLFTNNDQATVTDSVLANVLNDGDATITGSTMAAVTNNADATITGSTMTSFTNNEEATASLTDSVVNNDVTNANEITLTGTTVKGNVANTGVALLEEGSVVDGTVLNDKEITVANSTIKGLFTNNDEATVTDSVLANVLNDGDATITGSTMAAVTNNADATITGSTMTSFTNNEEATASLTDSVVNNDVTNANEITLTGTTVKGNVANTGVALLEEGSVVDGTVTNDDTITVTSSTIKGLFTNNDEAIVTSSILGGLVNTADGVATLTDSTVNDDVVNSGEASISGTTIKGAVTNSGTTELSENTVVDGTVLNDKEITVANSTIKGLFTNNDEATVTDSVLANVLNNGDTTITGSTMASFTNSEEATASLTDSIVNNDVTNANEITLTGTTVKGNVVNTGVALLEEGSVVDGTVLNDKEITVANSTIKGLFTNNDEATVTSSVLGSFTNTADATATLTGSTVNNDVTNANEITLTGTTVKGNVANTGVALLEEGSVVDGTVLNDKEITVANSTIKGLLTNNDQATVTSSVLGSFANGEEGVAALAGTTVEGNMTNSGSAELTENTVVDGNVTNDNEITVANSTIKGATVNNGTLNINEGSSVQAVSGSGVMNINSDYEFLAAVAGNTVNVNEVKISGINQLAEDTSVNMIGSDFDIGNQNIALKSITFDENSTLSLLVNSLSDFGTLIADNIVVSDGAKLKATLAPGIVTIGRTATIQLLRANNTDFNHFTDVFDNNMYHFDKVGNDGMYRIKQVRTAEDVVNNFGGRDWVAKSARSYIDSDTFAKGTVPAVIADQLMKLAQNDGMGLIRELEVLAPIGSSTVYYQTLINSERLFKTVDGHLRGATDPLKVSAEDKDSGIAIWMKSYVGRSEINGQDAIFKQTTNDRGVIGTIEKRFGSEFKVGLGLQYNEADVSMSNRTIDASSLIGFGYGEYALNNWFVNAVGYYERADYDEKKAALGTQYGAKYTGSTASAGVVAGYKFGNFIPEVGMRYYRIERDAYTDDALQHVDRANINLVRAVAGSRIMKDYGIFTPNLYLGLSYDIISSNNDTCVNLNNGASYVIKGERLPRLGLEMDIGVNAHVTENMTLSVNYVGSFRKNYYDHAGMIGLKYNF